MSPVVLCPVMLDSRLTSNSPNPFLWGGGGCITQAQHSTYTAL